MADELGGTKPQTTKSYVPTLSRFDADMFTRNLHYAASYWQEHGSNFEEMVEKMMKEPTLHKVAENAEMMCLAFTERTKWLSAQYNKEIIYPALEKAKEKILQDRNWISKFMWEYFSVFVRKRESLSKIAASRTTANKQDLGNAPELVQIKKFFLDQKEEYRKQAGLLEIGKSLIPNFVEDDFLTTFLPSLMLYFLRFLDIYDSALQGFAVDDYLFRLKNPAMVNPVEKADEDAIKQAVGEKLLKAFGKKEFWEKRYSEVKENYEAHDWYLPWAIIREKVLGKTTLGSSTEPLSILQLGCGTSALAEDIVSDEDAKVKKIISIDYVPKVIELQQQRADDRDLDDKLAYRLMDASKLDYPKGSFDMVIDKGTLDSMICADNGGEQMKATLLGASKVLKPGGFFVLVSCAITYDKIGILELPVYDWQVLHVSDFSAQKNDNQRIAMTIARKNGGPKLEAQQPEEADKAKTQ